MAVVPFSAALRERTWQSHGESEHSGFMADLMKGEGTREDYIALVVQHYYIYEALEAAAETMANDPIAQNFVTSKLTRMPSLIADLEFLVGANWREEITPLPSTLRYVERINEVGSTWAGGFIAHHYTRYLGDLSGGQAISRMMSRYFGFEGDGVLFYLFEEITKPREFKDEYRQQLDAVEWSEEEQDRVIDEVLLAYSFNTELFEDLSRAKIAA